MKEFFNIDDFKKAVSKERRLLRKKKAQDAAAGIVADDAPADVPGDVVTAVVRSDVQKDTVLQSVIDTCDDCLADWIRQDTMLVHDSAEEAPADEGNAAYEEYSAGVRAAALNVGETMETATTVGAFGVGGGGGGAWSAPWAGGAVSYGGALPVGSSPSRMVVPGLAPSLGAPASIAPRPASAPAAQDRPDLGFCSMCAKKVFVPPEMLATTPLRPVKCPQCGHHVQLPAAYQERRERELEARRFSASARVAPGVPVVAPRADLYGGAAGAPGGGGGWGGGVGAGTAKPLSGARIFICRRGLADHGTYSKQVEFLGGAVVPAVTSATHVLTKLTSLAAVAAALPAKIPEGVTCHDADEWVKAARKRSALPARTEFMVV